LSKHGGELTTTGSVSWNFERKGVVTIEAGKGRLDEDDLLMSCAEAGADDFRIDGEVAEVYSDVENLNNVRAWFEENPAYGVKTHELSMVPKETVEIGELSEAKKILRILDALEDNDDVQNVYSNWSMSDSLMEEAAAG
jgi:transcriptional/translational regulatory protein YebC/TACO1